jgi:hypothetical protein
MLMISSSPFFMQSDDGFDSEKKNLWDNQKNKWMNPCCATQVPPFSLAPQSLTS